MKRIVVWKQIEQKWQQKWIDEKIFEADPDSRKKCFVNFAFPYVNGPLHLGHAFSFTRMDVYARFKRMQGYNVLFPFAFHATGEPVLGVAKRLERGDEVQKRILIEEGIKEKDISKFKDPKYIAEFWRKRAIEDIDMLGAGVDWRRQFITIDPEFNRFIEWQYNLLKRKGYVVRGTHPVVWCPNCESPTGDHDRLEGEGAGPDDYLVYKFKLENGEILPMATLRPETIYGVTNVWVNPSVTYVRTKVNNETWIISESAVKKMKDQLYKVEVVGKIKGRDLIGKYVVNPVTQNKVLVLPADFVDPGSATGIVMSVPSHAPYDWIALQDAKKKDLLKKEYKIDPVEIESIKPISVIKVESFNEHPAIEMCQQMQIQNQREKEKLEQATKTIYKKEYHKGVLKKNCGKFAGLKVSECKKWLIKEFELQGYGSKMWEPTARVMCRCGTQCHIKILEKQWFLKFSDKKWKDLARRCVEKMTMYPEGSRKLYFDVIDWLEDKACARKSGMGTRLPWDKEWIVETLSDSVIYMAFYTIAKHIYENGMEPDMLKEAVFDYVFLNKGKVDDVAKKSSISKQKLQAMKKEFDYWYPFDLRGSAKELIPNHLTFCIFHHVAIWPEDKWPRGFTVNGMQQMYGKKMSKSKGNFITLKESVERYTADAIRITLMDSSEGMEDPDWTEIATLAWRSKLDAFARMVETLYSKGNATDKKMIDAWIESRFVKHVSEATKHLEAVENRSALAVWHYALNDFQWYCKRRGDLRNDVIGKCLEAMVKMLAPYTPFVCEELWSKMGKGCFVSLSDWPKVDGRVDKDVEMMEDNFRKACEDIRHVVRLSGKNNRLYLYFALPKELEYFLEGKWFIEKEFGFKAVEMILADRVKYDPEGKAKRAKFGKPGIYAE